MKKILEQIGLLVLSCLPFNLWAQAEDGLAPEKPEVLSVNVVYTDFDYNDVVFDAGAYVTLTIKSHNAERYTVWYYRDWETDIPEIIIYQDISSLVVGPDTVCFTYKWPDWGARWLVIAKNSYGWTDSDLILINDYITDESIREAFETFVGIESLTRDEEVEAEVFTTGGQRVGSCLMRNGRADLSGLPRGIYVVKRGGKARKVAVK